MKYLEYMYPEDMRKHAEIERLLSSYNIAVKTPESRERWMDRAEAVGATAHMLTSDRSEAAAEMLGHLRAIRSHLGRHH